VTRSALVFLPRALRRQLQNLHCSSDGLSESVRISTSLGFCAPWHRLRTCDDARLRRPRKPMTTSDLKRAWTGGSTGWTSASSAWTGGWTDWNELTWGSAPHPGSVARGDPCAPLRSLAGAPCAPRTAMRRLQREQNSRNAPYSGPRSTRRSSAKRLPTCAQACAGKSQYPPPEPAATWIQPRTASAGVCAKKSRRRLRPGVISTSSPRTWPATRASTVIQSQRTLIGWRTTRRGSRNSSTARLRTRAVRLSDRSPPDADLIPIQVDPARPTMASSSRINEHGISR
jgi:hypothetical protein